ncbi:YidH family protein [Streptomyces sp. TP-A0874]|uniref:YidH family protein n=1 Tax=Streptomyces sp. TP-A0874 TaxID=549819 RepID=UPI000B0826AD|nr:DUF202 domain-containing protein [Streptomyces sp. TP-A0874]
MTVSLRAVAGWLRSAVGPMRLWLAPQRIRDQGETPDYRFSLANERTFLAWLRTSLALIGGGFAVAQFLSGLHEIVRVALAALLVGGGATCAVRAVNHWVRCELAIRRGEDLPPSRFPAVLAIGVGLLAVAMMLVTIAGPTGG